MLINQIRDYIEPWNADPRPFARPAADDENLAKAQLVHSNINKLVANNSK